MYDAFFEERGLIPPGDYHELAYEDLERDPLEQMRGLYQALNLPDFTGAEARLSEFLSGTANYQKNTFRPLPEDLRSRLAREWAPSFRAWGYSTGASKPALANSGSRQ
jgi:omega-hydroxy-beta-dihydromenaquinone-9 sulfotransferase